MTWGRDSQLTPNHWCLGNRSVVGIGVQNLVGIGVETVEPTILPQGCPVGIWCSDPEEGESRNNSSKLADEQPEDDLVNFPTLWKSHDGQISILNRRDSKSQLVLSAERPSLQTSRLTNVSCVVVNECDRCKLRVVGKTHPDSTRKVLQGGWQEEE